MNTVLKVALVVCILSCAAVAEAQFFTQTVIDQGNKQTASYWNGMRTKNEYFPAACNGGTNGSVFGVGDFFGGAPACVNRYIQVFAGPTLVGTCDANAQGTCGLQTPFVYSDAQVPTIETRIVCQTQTETYQYNHITYIVGNACCDDHCSDGNACTLDNCNKQNGNCGPYPCQVEQSCSGGQCGACEIDLVDGVCKCL